MRRNGFSLLETLVVVGLSAILGLTTFLVVGRRQSSSELSGAAQQAVSALRTAQLNALNGVSSTPWGVRFDNTNTAFPWFAVYASSTYATTTQVMRYPMNSRIMFTTASVPAGTAKTVHFGLRSGMTTSTSVAIQARNGTMQWTLSVSTSGVVTATSTQ